MSCTINLNKDGSIKTVLTPEGVESNLFKQISKIPHVATLEDALEAFKNVYSDKLRGEKKSVSSPGVNPEILTKFDSLRAKVDASPTARIKEKAIQELSNFIDSNLASIETELQKTNVLTKEC